MPESNSIAPETTATTKHLRRLFRFSLGRMLLVLFVACLIGSHLRTSWLLYDANRTLKQYRTEFGHLSIEDPTKVYAIAVDPHQELTWQWRVYIPPGEKYELCSIYREIPGIRYQPDEFKFPKQRSTHYSLVDGELLITLSIQRDGQNRWRFHELVTDNTGYRNHQSWGIRDEDMAPIISDKILQSHRGILKGSPQQTFDINSNVLLLKLRAPSSTNTDPGEATDGLMFWLSPVGS